MRWLIGVVTIAIALGVAPVAQAGDITCDTQRYGEDSFT